MSPLCACVVVQTAEAVSRFGEVPTLASACADSFFFASCFFCQSDSAALTASSASILQCSFTGGRLRYLLMSLFYTRDEGRGKERKQKRHNGSEPRREGGEMTRRDVMWWETKLTAI